MDDDVQSEDGVITGVTVSSPGGGYGRIIHECQISIIQSSGGGFEWTCVTHPTGTYYGITDLSDVLRQIENHVREAFR